MEKVGHVMVADGVPEVLERTREAPRMGATQIKISGGGGVSSSFDPLDVTQFTVEETKAAVDAAKDWNTYVATHVFTDDATRRALEVGVISVEHGHLLSQDTLQLMAKKGAYLSMQPIFNDEDALQFPEGSFSQEKFLDVVAGTDKVYGYAKQAGVKIVWGRRTARFSRTSSNSLSIAVPGASAEPRRSSTLPFLTAVAPRAQRLLDRPISSPCTIERPNQRRKSRSADLPGSLPTSPSRESP